MFRDNIDGSRERTIGVLEQMGLRRVTDFGVDDEAIAKYVSAVIALRAAKLVAINTAVLLARQEHCADDADEHAVIAYDGSVVKHHPRIKSWMEMYIERLAPYKPV